MDRKTLSLIATPSCDSSGHGQLFTLMDLDPLFNTKIGDEGFLKLSNPLRTQGLAFQPKSWSANISTTLFFVWLDENLKSWT